MTCAPRFTFADLLVDAGATVNGNDIEVFELFSKGLEVAGNLYAQLGWGASTRACVGFALVVDQVKQRKAKGCGLTGARLGQPYKNLLFLQKDWNRLFLNRGRCLKAEQLHRLD